MKSYFEYPIRKLRAEEKNWPCRICLGSIHYGERYRGALSRRVHEGCLQRAIKAVSEGQEVTIRISLFRILKDG